MGWVWKQDQAWRGAYRDEAGKQHTKSFKRQIDAKRWVATEEVKVVRGDWVNPAAGKVTFAAFYADWSPRQVWLSSTRENADLAIAGVTFGDMPLRAIRRSHVEAWVKQMSTSLAPSTIDTRFTIVRGVFRAAVADRLIPSDPTLGVVLPRKRKAEAAMSIPTNADVATLLNAAEPPNRPKSRPGFTAFVALCAFAGLRRGEALGVQVGDIDFLARTLRIKRQIQRAKAADIATGKDLVEAVAGITVIVRSPKYESERTIYLPDEVVGILSEHLRQHTPTGEPSPQETFLRQAVTLLSGDIARVAAAHVADALRPEAYEAISAELNELVAAGIPPSRLAEGIPSSWDIVLAGWQTAIATRGDAPMSISAAAEDRPFNEFLLKSLEIAKITEVWDES